MLMTCRCPGEGLGSWLNCRGGWEPGRSGLDALLKLSSSIFFPAWMTLCLDFSISHSHGMLDLTVAQKLITKTRIGEACVLSSTLPALPLTWCVTLGQ